MSNARRATGAIPAAFARDGREIPPSADVLEHGLAQVIGESTALHLAEMLGQLLPQMPWRPDCFFCLLRAKKLVRDYQVAVAVAQKAGEPVPDPPAPPSVARAVTQVIVTQLVQTPAGTVPASGGVWACWEHVELPAEPPRQVGLVGLDGQPIIARR